MPLHKFIVLDSYPLGDATITLDEARAGLTEGARCRQWMVDCETAGATLLVPAIAYYEEARELYRRQATAKIARFQNFCFDLDRFLPLSSENLTFAGQLWGQLRRTGQATSDPHALDGDCILAAQVLALNLPPGEYVVATRNAKHLTRFGLFRRRMGNIAA